MKRTVLVLSIVVLAACGGGGSPDAGPDGTAPHDAGADAHTPTDSGPHDAMPTDMPVIPPADAGPGDVQLVISSSMRVAPISPYIYGDNGPDWSRGGVTLTRSGGNRLTAYNWENNASNAGSDYMFQNDDFMCSGTGCDAPGEAMRRYVMDTFAHHASAIVTLPMAGYVSADKAPGGDVRGSGGGYLATRFRQSMPAKGSAFALAPDTGDAFVYQDEFVNWLETTFPGAHADPTQTIFYMLDNEPDLWSSTHAEIHPTDVTYDELTTKSIALATAVKAVAPDALVLGPVSYGWNGYVNLQNATDAGGRDFVEYYLDTMSAAEGTAGHRLLDALDLHWYPEATGGGTRITDPGATSPAAVTAREQAPRSLWDDTYTEDSWITMFSTMGPIRLVPRMRDKIAAHYPGTHLSLSEYNYGGGADVSGAIAEADALGIFGREGVWAACIWPLDTDSFIHTGLAAYRNYDGAGGAFGDTSIAADTSDVVRATVYASVDAANPNRMVVVAINKDSGSLDAAVTITHTVSFSHAAVYTITSAGPSIAHGADVAVTGNAFHYAMPAQSVSVLVLTP